MCTFCIHRGLPCVPGSDQAVSPMSEGSALLSMSNKSEQDMLYIGNYYFNQLSIEDFQSP